MTSSTGWRETIRISAKSVLVSKPWAGIEDSKPDAHSFRVAASRAALAASYRRVACPIAAHTTISKTWSLLDVRYPGGVDVLVGNSIGMTCYLVGKRTQWLAESLLLNAAPTLATSLDI